MSHAILTAEAIEDLHRKLSKPGMVIKPREDGCYSVHRSKDDLFPKWAAAEWHPYTNDALTLSDAHRLLSVLRDETQSRAVHAECEDVMARLSKIVEG